MRGGIESLRWINDREGKEYVCYSDDVNDKKTYDELSAEEKVNCEDVNQLIGTERW